MRLDVDGHAQSVGGDEPLIRTGTAADIPTVLDLWGVAGAVSSVTDSIEGLEQLLDRDSEALLVAISGEELIGSLIAAWDGWRGSFYRLAVHPDWRRRAVAIAVVRAGEDRLRALGAVRLTAIVASDETQAMGFWKAAGYELQENRSRFVRVLRS